MGKSRVRLFKDCIQERSAACNLKVIWLAVVPFNLFSDERWIHCGRISGLHLFHNGKPPYDSDCVGRKPSVCNALGKLTARIAGKEIKYNFKLSVSNAYTFISLLKILPVVAFIHAFFNYFIITTSHFSNPNQNIRWF